MPFLIQILKRILLDPTFDAFAIIGITNFLSKKIMQKQSPEDKIKNANPMFLPKGTIRAIITLILLGTVIASMIMNFELPKEFLALTVFAVGYYIGYRTDNQINEIKG